ncbi:MAG TPA: putative LPS assembly protein LptD [Candidatus Saccharimonadales bacterium]|nr:putative LPS assembly protein LptD [Candidatus Saccharimonadales bacterium]
MNRNLSKSNPGKLKRVLFAPLLAIFALPAFPQEFPSKPPRGAIAEIAASGPQRREGPVYIADKDVDIRYLDMRLQADHVEYNTDTYMAKARGHIIFDYENQHLEGDEAELNVDTGRGTFRNVRGQIRLQRQPNPLLLVSENPLYFEAQLVERFGEDYYEIYHSWFTVCEPKEPTWQFYAPEAKLTVGKSVAMVNANFRLFRIPLFWSPYSTAPAGNHMRQSGFLMPIIGNSNTKGFTIGDAFYWAPNPWMDATAGFEYFGKRGPAERVNFRATPFEDTSIRYSFFAVQDREDQGGYEQQLQIQSLWNHGWRFVTDLNQLSSLTFRLAFAGTYGEAVNSEIRSAVFLTNNFHGFSFNAAALNDKSYLEISPQTSVVLRDAPELRFSSVEQAPWKNLPIYLSFTSFAGAVYRDDSYISTVDFVPRAEFAPRVTIPFHFGQWLGVTTSATFRTTFYGDSFNTAGDVSGQSITRNTGEFLVELRPPALERFFDRPASRHRYKHTIEPVINYFYVTGVNDFQRFIRFDSNATLTDTSEIEYGINQHLYVKHGDDQPVDFLSWTLVQKHYFDSTFNGALVTGQRNVFQALDSVTPFAFAASPRNRSPIVSDVKLTPGGRYDAESIIEYDPQLSKVTTIGTLLKVKPYSEFFATVADFRLQGNPIVQLPSHQIRGIIGWGDITRKGLNVAAGVNYDILQDNLLNQFVQVSYNGSCCGLSVEYGRFNLANVRSENQFRVALILANIGTFGNLHKLEKIF